MHFIKIIITIYRKRVHDNKNIMKQSSYATIYSSICRKELTPFTHRYDTVYEPEKCVSVISRKKTVIVTMIAIVVNAKYVIVVMINFQYVIVAIVNM